MKESRIVLLERDDLARELYTEFLVGQGFRVRAEALFDDALAALKKGGAPVLVAGIAPGGATVAQLATAIRRHAPHTALLALLGRDAAEGTLRAVRDGALEALAKPVSPEALTLAVRRCLETTVFLEHAPSLRRQMQVFLAARRIQRAGDAAAAADLLLESCLASSGADAGVALRPTGGGLPEIWAARGVDEAVARELAAGLDWTVLADADDAVVWLPRSAHAAELLADGHVATPLDDAAPRARKGKPLAQLALVRVGPPEREKLWIALAFGPKGAAAWQALPEDERAAREGELALYASQAVFALELVHSDNGGLIEGSFDPLTDLLDARSLERSVSHEITLARKADRGCSLLTVDFERLDEVRAAQGELVISQALVEASRLLSRQVREVDLVARTGDASFGVLLPATPLAGGQKAAERIRSAFSGRRFLAREGLDLPLAVAVGVAGFPEHGEDLAALVGAARNGGEKRGVLGRRRTTRNG